MKLQDAQMNEKNQAYQRVIDANHRQSLSSKEQEILELKRQAEEERRIQNDRITQLEQMVQSQMQHNLKLQSMLDSQFAQARPPPVVETAAMTATAEAFTSSATGSEYVRPTSKATPAAPPPKMNFPPAPTVPVAFGLSMGRTLDEEEEVEITYLDPKYSKGPVPVKKEPGITRSSNSTRPPGGVASNLFDGVNFNQRGNSPVPNQRYSPSGSGPDENNFYDPGDDDAPHGNDPGDGGNGNGGGGGRPPTPPDPNDGNSGDKGRKVPKGNKPKGGSGPLMVMTVGMTRTKMTKTMMRNSDAE